MILAAALLILAAEGYGAAHPVVAPRQPGVRLRILRQDDTDEADEAEVRAQVDRMIDRSKNGTPVVRPQAASRLVSMGEPAKQRLLELIEATPRGLADLGKDLVEALGRFGDPKLRRALWNAHEDRDFPWRPAAARSLARSADPAELRRFRAMLGDPIASVRHAALLAYGELDARDYLRDVRDALADEDDRVRREAASLLDTWGQGWALRWLVEDLSRDDRYFQLETGRQARFASYRILQERLGDLAGYDPRAAIDAPKNLEAVAHLEKTLEAKSKTPLDIPYLARAGHATEGDVLGLELRSCRRGEFFLRWNRNDVLYVGTGNAYPVPLPEGTVARLEAALESRLPKLGEQVVWGEPGCDLEQFHWHPDPTERPTILRISKGPDAVEGLRPDPLTEIAKLLLATLPEDGAPYVFQDVDAPDAPPQDPNDPRLTDLRTRVEEALAVLGGPVS